MATHYRQNAKPLPPPPRTKWELYVKLYGARKSPPVAFMTAINVGSVLTGCALRIYLRPDRTVVVINAAIAAFFTLLWVAAFVRVRKVPVAPSGSGSGPGAS